MVKVNERRTLHDVLKEPKFVIPEIPGLFVLSHWCLFSNSCYRVRLPSLMSLFLCFGFSLVTVFYIVSKRSKFYKDFIAGKWSPPS